jgi:hypothetical protein
MISSDTTQFCSTFLLNYLIFFILATDFRQLQRTLLYQKKASEMWEENEYRADKEKKSLLTAVDYNPFYCERNCLTPKNR